MKNGRLLITYRSDIHAEVATTVENGFGTKSVSWRF